MPPNRQETTRDERFSQAWVGVHKADSGGFSSAGSQRIPNPGALLLRLSRLDELRYSVFTDRSVPWKTLVPSCVRDDYWTSLWKKCLLTEVCSWDSADGVWSMTLALAHPLEMGATHLLLIVSCNLHLPSQQFTIKDLVTLKISIPKTQQMTDEEVTDGQLHLTDFERARARSTLPRVPLNDVHYARVVELDIEVFDHILRDFRRGPPNSCALHCEVVGTIALAPRRDLSQIGRGLQLFPDLLWDIVDIGNFSLRDVLHLSLVCKGMRVSVAGQARRRVLKALGRYFPQAVDEFSSLLLKEGALVTGPTVLSILAPGNWEPATLDIIVPEQSARMVDECLSSYGYHRDPTRERQLPKTVPEPGSYSALVRYGCFSSGTCEINMCYLTAPVIPRNHILFDPTSVSMNYFTGNTVVCLFPEHTFAGVSLKNDVFRLPTRGRHAPARETYKDKGFVGNGYMTQWFREREPNDEELEDDIFAGIPIIWRQVVNLK